MGRLNRLTVALAIVVGLLFASALQYARADVAVTDTVSIPTGMDANLVTSGILIFLAIAGAAVAAAIGLRLLPVVARYVFGWTKWGAKPPAR